MKALIFLPVMAAMVATVFAQVPVDSRDEKKWKDPDYQEALALADQFLDRVHSRNYKAAVALMPETPDVKQKSKQALRKFRNEGFDQRLEKLSRFGQISNRQLISIWKHTSASHPDDVLFYQVEYKYDAPQKASGVPEIVTVMRKGSTLEIYRYDGIY